MSFSKSYLLLVTSFLFITSLSAKDFKGAEYRTKDSFLYGRFEVRMKSAQRDGVLSTFFTYFDGLPDDPWAYSKWNEIDLEIIGRYNNDVQFNTITYGQSSHVSHIWTDFNPAEDYHTYAFEWTPEYVAWFIDGQEVRRQTAGHILTLTRAQKIMMNTWNPEYPVWVGDWNPEVLPAYTFYDWVSYSTYVPGNGNSGTGNNFQLQWNDDFNTFDTTRWEKATHTFGGNGCDFIQENAVIKDGKLILCLTKENNIGYNDIAGPKLLWARVTDTIITVKFNEFVEKKSAETKTNYVIPGLTVRSATVTDDHTIVELLTSKSDPSITYKLVSQNIYDLNDPPRKSEAGLIKTVRVFPITNFPVKIDVGTTSNPGSGFLADQTFNFDKEYGSLDGIFNKVNDEISGTDEDTVFQSNNVGIAMYKVRLPKGIYKITMLFSENSISNPDARLFDITVENSSNKFNSIDLFKVTGKNSAYSISADNIRVEDGTLDIHFSSITAGYTAVLSGLKIDLIKLLTSLNEEPNLYASNFEVKQNFPNPFNPSTIISYSLHKPENVKISIVDVSGRSIYSELLGFKGSKSNQFVWNGRDNSGKPASSGIYFFYLEGQTRSETKKMILLK